MNRLVGFRGGPTTDHEAMLRVKAVDPDSLPRWTEFLRQRGLVVLNSVNHYVEPAHRTLRG